MNTISKRDWRRGPVLLLEPSGNRSWQAVGNFFFDCPGSSLLCVPFPLAVASGGYSLAAVCGLFTAVNSLLAEHVLGGVLASVVAARGLRSY